MKTIRTPNGTHDPINKALDEWYDLAKPLMELGFSIHSFDPGVSFKSKECIGHLSVFTIACSDLKIINNAINLSKRVPDVHH